MEHFPGLGPAGLSSISPMPEVVRWAVGSSAGLRSSAWRLWGNKKGDIYAAVRSYGGINKVSFHRDGRCQVGFTTEYAPTAAQRFGVRSRHWQTWRLPDQPLVRALGIGVPASELRSAIGQDDDAVVWLPAPPEGSIAVVSIFLTPAGANLEAAPEARHATIFGKVQTSIRSAWAVYAHNPIDQATARMIEHERARLKAIPAPATGWPAGTRASLWEDRTDHNRNTLELALSDSVS